VSTSTFVSHSHQSISYDSNTHAASNILDVPNFFWESEPTLHPLYAAIREYLEIDPRIKVLNERCRVFLDLAEILSDSVADAKMSYITWIIIVLIILSIMVTTAEVGIRFGMLNKAKGTNVNRIITAPVLGDGMEQTVLPPSDLEILAQTLGLQANASFEDVHKSIWALQRKDLPDASILHEDI
jgi:hypothetical protein